MHRAFAPVPAGVYPANATAAYRSSEKRAPREPLIVIPHTLSETSGPRFGREMLRGASQDLTRPGGAQVISSFVPLSEMFGYTTDLRSSTQGRATSTMHFARYDQAPRNVAEEVIAKVKGAAK